MLFNCLLIVCGYLPTASVRCLYKVYTYELTTHPPNFYTDNFSTNRSVVTYVWKLYCREDCSLAMGLLVVVGIGLPGLHFCIITSSRVFPNQPGMLTFLWLPMFISLHFFSFLLRIPTSTQQTSYLLVCIHIHIFVMSFYSLSTPA